MTGPRQRDWVVTFLVSLIVLSAVLVLVLMMASYHRAS